MSKTKKVMTLHTLGIIVASWAVLAFASEQSTPGLSAERALQSLRDGNKRYVESQMSAYKSCDPRAREKLAKGQKPHTIVLSCSDSRVPPEIIFDQGLGEIFVVRVAGNIPDPVVLGSIEYAAEHLGTPLILILGHTQCGAVKATVEAPGKVEGNIGAIVSTIKPAVNQARKKVGHQAKDKLIQAAIEENVRLAAQNLIKQSKVLKHLLEEKKIKIVLGQYDLEDGKVSFLEK